MFSSTFFLVLIISSGVVDSFKLSLYDDETTTEQTTTEETTARLYIENSTTAVNHVEEKDDIVRLDVAGTKFHTFRSTLTAIPNSRLAKIFQVDPKTKKRINTYFFDYNPEHFGFLLDQLRSIRYRDDFRSYNLDFEKHHVTSGSLNFSMMLADLGLRNENFLYPLNGVHIDLNISSLIGWKLCHRSKYNKPLDSAVFTRKCAGKRILAACRNLNNPRILKLAGITEPSLVVSCPTYYNCFQTHNLIKFYNMNNKTWGFACNTLGSNYHNPHYSYNQQQNVCTRCDSDDVGSRCRLCWSLKSEEGATSGDRCGEVKNLHNNKTWERLIFYIE